MYEIASMKIMQLITEIFRKTRRLVMAKRTARATVEMHMMKDWTSWRGRPPPKSKKKLQIQEEPDNVGARPLRELHPPLLCVRKRVSEEKNTLDDCRKPDSQETYQETARDELFLRRERMYRIESDHRGRNRTTGRKVTPNRHHKHSVGKKGKVIHR
jgi:hypothetical protein